MRTTEMKISLPAAVALGTGVSLTVSVLGCMLTAWLMDGEKIGQGSTDIASTVCTAAAVLVGSCLASKQVQGRRMQVCLLTGLGYYLSMLAVTALFFDGLFSGLLMPALIVAVISVIVGFMTTKPKKQSYSKRAKRAFR